jgi:23S rRNA pseudouridine1911/1915/1917 synthase
MAVREDGREAQTDWVVEARFGPQAALVRALPRTGRTHQIRVHLAHLGHPILGDRTYGKFDLPIFEGWPMPRVMLHAHRLRVTHPVTGKEMTFEAPVPADFRTLERWLTKKYGRRDYTTIA